MVGRITKAMGRIAEVKGRIYEMVGNPVKASPNPVEATGRISKVASSFWEDSIDPVVRDS
jgi:hypothetical protein